jgi:hypothetical protein
MVGRIRPRHVTGPPTIHKVKAPSHSIHINHFTAEKETRADFGLHRLHVNLLERHTTCRNYR